MLEELLRIRRPSGELKIVWAYVAPSRFMTTPYASKSKDTAWYEEQEESSPPWHLGMACTGKRALSLELLVGRARTETHIPSNYWD